MRHYPAIRMSSQRLTPAYLAARDAVVVVTDHSAYDWNFIVQHAPLIIDTRNALKSIEHDGRVVKA